MKPKRRKHFASRLIAAVGLLLPVLAIQPATQAHAAVTLGQLAWQSDLTGTNQQQLLTNTDGGITIGSCYGGSTAIKRFGFDGTVTGTIANTLVPTPSICQNQSAVGADGTLYGLGDPGGGQNLVVTAYKNGNTSWWAALPPTTCTGNVTVDSMGVGADGNVYTLLTDWCNSTGQPRLVGFNPNLAAGQTTPTVTLNQVLPGSYAGGPMPNLMAVYNGGLVFRYDNNLRYYNYAGVAGTVWPVNYGPSYNRRLSADPATGRVFVPLPADPSMTTGCDTPSMAIGQIDHYDSNSVRIPSPTYVLDRCSSVISIHSTPSGGALITTRAAPPGAAVKNHLIMLDAGGFLVWDNTVDAPDTYQIDAMVDQAGQVLVWYIYNSGQQVRIDTYAAYNGSWVSHITTADIVPNTTFNFSMGNIAEAGGRVYLMANKCVNGYCYPTPTLYSIILPTAMDYPRGAILQPNNQPANYIALGDSYSSGEGVPPFLAPTDTDNCHRSTAAYSTLIPTYKAWLQQFVACSGATTTDLLNGKNGEPSQLQALNSNTKVVTLTIGGNDVNFAQVAQTCLLADCAPYRTQYMNNVATAGTKLSVAYDAILNAAPNAKIYVMGYPFVLPQAACAQTDSWMMILSGMAASAAGGNQDNIKRLNAIADYVGLSPTDRNVLLTSGSVQFSDAELSLVHDFTAALDQQIQATVASKGSRMVYVDPTVPTSPFAGHTLCTGSNSFFNGLDLSINNDQLSTVYSFHPNASGQAAYQQLVASYLP